MRNALEDVLKLAADHPLIAFWLALMLGLALLLGIIHELRVIVLGVTVLVREGKHGLRRLWDALKEFGREFKSWKSDP
ncbi:MAG TPA: hypothetical protein VEK57_26605 [Thermoanaerobaculia bacterium]|nr:hypothetical protein [Thermoanaerobaculia bacterium]